FTTHAHGNAGAASARLSLRPLRFRGTTRLQNSGKSCRGNESVCSTVITSKPKRSTYPRGERGIATSRLIHKRRLRTFLGTYEISIFFRNVAPISSTTRL